MKKILALLLITLCISGCSSNGVSSLTNKTPEPLAVLSIPEDEHLLIDVRDDFDPTTILSDVEEGTEVTYVLDEENSKVVITLTKEDRTETLEKSVEIQYPLGSFVDDEITIDTYAGYDINELVAVDEDVEVSEVLDEENSKLIVTLTKGDREEVIELPVELTSSAPKTWTYELKFTCACGPLTGEYSELADQVSGYLELNEDGTGVNHSNKTMITRKVDLNITWDKNTIYWPTGATSKLYFADDMSTVKIEQKGVCNNGSDWTEFGTLVK